MIDKRGNDQVLEHVCLRPRDAGEGLFADIVALAVLVGDIKDRVFDGYAGAQGYAPEIIRVIVSGLRVIKEPAANWDDGIGENKQIFRAEPHLGGAGHMAVAGELAGDRASARAAAVLKDELAPLGVVYIQRRSKRVREPEGNAEAEGEGHVQANIFPEVIGVFYHG